MLGKIMKDRRVFISGGAGVIGRALVKELHQMGALIFVGDLKSRPRDWPNEIMYRQGDLNEIKSWELTQFEPEFFFHLAATFERSTETYEFFHDNYWNNLCLSHHLMSILKDTPQLKRIIFASSYLIYNPDLYLFDTVQIKPVALQESTEVFPRNLTGVAKLMHELELRFLNSFKSDQYTAVSARIFRGYGKGSRCIISRWIRDLINKKPISIYKKEGMFDYIYADDAAKGLIKIAEVGSLKDIINLGTGKARKVEDIIKILQKYFPSMVTREVETKIQYEASVADVGRLKMETNWEASTTLEDAIPKIIEYERQIIQDNNQCFGNVLLTSISKKVPHIKALKKAASKLCSEIKVHGGDTDINCIGRYFVDEFWEMPPLEELTIKILVDYCKEHNIVAIIPTRDGELSFLSKIKNKLKAHGISIMVSDRKTVDTCLDKLQFYQSSSSFLDNVIPTYISAKEVQSDHLVVKERYGSGSGGIGIKLDRDVAVKHALLLQNPVFQPYIQGKEVSVDCFIDNKKNIKGIIMRSRDKVINGESQITTTFYNEKLYSLCDAFIKNYNFYGHVILQFIQNQNKYHIMEVNARIGGASTLSIQIGLDSLYWFLLEANNQDLSRYDLLHTDKTKVFKQVRYPTDEIMEIQ